MPPADTGPAVAEPRIRAPLFRSSVARRVSAIRCRPSRVVRAWLNAVLSAWAASCRGARIRSVPDVVIHRCTVRWLRPVRPATALVPPSARTISRRLSGRLPVIIR